MKDQCALVTGASSGIGWATSLGLARQGAKVLAVARREPRLRQLAAQAEQEKSAGKIIPIAADIRDLNQLTKIFGEYPTEMRSLSILVNNAGLARGKAPLWETLAEDIDEMLDVNFRSLVHLTRLCLPYLRARGSGDIVNLGSVAGRWVYPGGHTYSATKFAVRAFSEALRMDLKGEDIRVINVEPGMVKTEFSEVRFRDSEKAEQVYAGMQALTAEDIADTILWCLLRPRHVNVQEIVVFPTDQAAVGQVAHRPNRK